MIHGEPGTMACAITAMAGSFVGSLSWMRDVPDPINRLRTAWPDRRNIRKSGFENPAALMGFAVLRSLSCARVLRHFCPSNPPAVFQASLRCFSRRIGRRFWVHLRLLGRPRTLAAASGFSRAQLRMSRTQSAQLPWTFASSRFVRHLQEVTREGAPIRIPFASMIRRRSPGRLAASGAHELGEL